MSGFFTLEVHLMPPGGVIKQINSQRPAGEVLESFATKARDKNTALSFLTRMTKRHGQPKVALSQHWRRHCQSKVSPFLYLVMAAKSERVILFGA